MIDNRRATDEDELAVEQAEPRKPARRILEQEIAQGLSEMKRPSLGLFISGLSAGLDIGFSPYIPQSISNL